MQTAPRLREGLLGSSSASRWHSLPTLGPACHTPFLCAQPLARGWHSGHTVADACRWVGDSGRCLPTLSRVEAANCRTESGRHFSPAHGQAAWPSCFPMSAARDRGLAEGCELSGVCQGSVQHRVNTAWHLCRAGRTESAGRAWALPWAPGSGPLPLTRSSQLRLRINGIQELDAAPETVWYLVHPRPM